MVQEMVQNSFSYRQVDVPGGFLHLYTYTQNDGFTAPFQLPAHEQGRAKRYTNATDRDRYIQAHVFLRQVLANYLYILPGDIVFEYTTFGKPVLAGKHKGPVHFNISYSGELLVIAVCSLLVGVDVEQVYQLDDIDAVAGNFFSTTERNNLTAITDTIEKQKYFFDVWTLKEAFIKGIGLGISYGLQSFTVIPGNNTNPVLLCNEAGWELKQLAMPVGYAGAVAIFPSS